MSSTFDVEAFSRLVKVEPTHFWFNERRRLIEWVLRRDFPAAKNFCEVGCGTGYVLAGLESAFPALALTGVENYPQALPFSQARLTRTRLLPGDICDLPFRGEFDVVGCFDVLEHIPDDRLALTNLARAVRPGGGLILTVPQHPSLWSVADEIGFHQRRYTRGQLRRLVTDCGLKCRRITSFVSFLLPLLWLRRRQARKVEDAFEELAPSRLSNWGGALSMRAERALIRAGVSLPIGGSLLLVATKPA